MNRWGAGAAVLAMCGAAGCGTVIQQIRAQLWATPEFAWADPGAPALTAELKYHGTYHYALRREPSGVATTLRAVAIHDHAVYAAGDGGVILRRSAGGGWVREPTPTTRTLRGLVGETIGNSELIAVGDAGTVLRRSPDGTWIAEPVPVAADLYAVDYDGSAVYAVGDRGTLLQRDGGVWQTIATHTGADLRRFSEGVAIGRGGAIVDCRAWEPKRAPLALRCVPRASPTHADLLASLHTETGWRAYGTGGTCVRATHLAPIDAVLDAPRPAAATITAVADAGDVMAHVIPVRVGDIDDGDGTVASILIGTGGLIEILGEPPVRIAVPGAPDLLGAALNLTDVFVVGTGGTILHLQAPDVRITPSYAI